jgi:pilus assembly protein Flp/PilA
MDPRALLRRFLREDSGQDLLEYGLLAALIAVVVVMALTTTGISINRLWTGITTSLASVA